MTAPDLGFALLPAFEALRLALGLVFVMSVAPKLRRFGRFQSALAGYDLLPERAVAPAALVVVAVELVLATALVSGLFEVLALWLGLGTLGVFSAAVSINIARGRAIPCGCFGEEDEPISARTLARLALLLAAAASLIVLQVAAAETAVARPSPLLGRAPEDLVSLAGTAAAFLLGGAWVVRAGELVALAKSETRLAD